MHVYICCIYAYSVLSILIIPFHPSVYSNPTLPLLYLSYLYPLSSCFGVWWGSCDGWGPSSCMQTSGKYIYVYTYIGVYLSVCVYSIHMFYPCLPIYFSSYALPPQPKYISYCPTNLPNPNLSAHTPTYLHTPQARYFAHGQNGPARCERVHKLPFVGHCWKGGLSVALGMCYVVCVYVCVCMGVCTCIYVCVRVYIYVCVKYVLYI